MATHRFRDAERADVHACCVAKRVKRTPHVSGRAHLPPAALACTRRSCRLLGTSRPSPLRPLGIDGRKSLMQSPRHPGRALSFELRAPPTALCPVCEEICEETTSWLRRRARTRTGRWHQAPHERHSSLFSSEHASCARPASLFASAADLRCSACWSTVNLMASTAALVRK